MCLCVGGQVGEHQCASLASGIPSPCMAGRQQGSACRGWAGSCPSQQLPGTCRRQSPSKQLSLQGFQEQQMGSSAPTVIHHLPGTQGMVISHPSVQLELHPHTRAAWIPLDQPAWIPLDQPWVQEEGSGQRPWGEGLARLLEEWAGASRRMWVVL